MRAVVVESTELGWDGAELTAAGQPVDFVYRHIFARRIEPESGLGRLLQAPQRHALSNPVAAPLEMKRTFAELSRAAQEPELADRRARQVGDGRDVTREGSPRGLHGAYSAPSCVILPRIVLRPRWASS